MIKTCQHCGAVNGEATEICCFCDVPLGDSKRPAASRRVATHTEGNLAIEPEWRREVSSRLQEYRVRRGDAASGNVQTGLPFEPAPGPTIESSKPKNKENPAPARRSLGLRRHLGGERFEVSIPTAESVPADVHREEPIRSQPAGRQGASLLPVASLPERRRAALIDGAFLLVTYGGMLTFFMILGGRIGMNKLDLAVTVATFGLFYLQYFALFTVFGGSTPGMMLRGLRVVSFDGEIPSSRQMVWRSFGYLISATTCFLGFVWALWDEDHLCWQDRISQTYLTPTQSNTSY